MKLRISMIVILFLAVLFMPYYITLPLILFGMIYFTYYWEGLLILLSMDLLYGIRNETFLGIYLFMFFSGLVAMLIIEIIRKKIRYKNRYGLEI